MISDLTIEKMNIEGLILLKPKVYNDERGFFMETYNENKFSEAGITCKFVQDNHSKSTYGVLRGLHHQIAPYAQAKLVRVIYGEIFDVAVDIRPNSPTFGKWEAVILSAENKCSLFIPEGFAHGFVVTSKEAEVVYKCNKLYAPGYEAGINWNDSKLAIKWPVANPIISAKDSTYSPF